MSDLAPFVAAVLRDKVVDEQREEIKELQKRNQLYEIKNRDGGVVYADGLLEDVYVVGLDSPLQSAGLLMILSKKSSCPLRELKDVCIFVAGHQKVTIENLLSPLTNNELFTDTLRDTDTCKSIFLGSSQQGAVAGVHLLIDGWPREAWSRDLDRSFLGSRFLNYLVDEVSVRHPEATVTFRKLGLNYKYEINAINNLPEPTRSRIHKECKAFEKDGEAQSDE